MKDTCTFRHLPGTKRPANRKDKSEAKHKDEVQKKEEKKKADEKKRTEERNKEKEIEERLESLPHTESSRGNTRKTMASPLPFLEKAGSVQETAGPVVEMMVELLQQMGRMMERCMTLPAMQEQEVRRRPAQFEPEEQYLVNQSLGAWGRPLPLLAARRAGQ